MSHKIFQMSFAKIYPLYIQKAEKKWRNKEEVDTIINWLTGYSPEALEEQVAKEVDVETFFNEAPEINPQASKIRGAVCGCKVEDITNPLMQQIRYLDKLVDELAKGKEMETILRK